MKLKVAELQLLERARTVRQHFVDGYRLGLITSIDGGQLITILVHPDSGEVIAYESALDGPSYASLTPTVPETHWFERTIGDMFGLVAEGHRRLKHTHLHRWLKSPPLAPQRTYQTPYEYTFMKVEGPGVYEIPVGPVHAGIIEPGHFRFSCYGEIILNLEIRLGYVHRGVERRLTECNWQNCRFIVEAAASDMPVANAIAHAVAVESLQEVKIPERAALLRTLALEVERVAMHLGDLCGLTGDIGWTAIASTLSRLRGKALAMGEQISGSRLMRAYVCPGGVTKEPFASFRSAMPALVEQLEQDFQKVIAFFLETPAVSDRMDGVGAVSRQLARDFGLVGVAARACGIDYDCRNWQRDTCFDGAFTACSEVGGDVRARAMVRIREVQHSLKLIQTLLTKFDETAPVLRLELSKQLPANSMAVGFVESHRGELIHLVCTNETGEIKRYCIKDPSVNNWTGLAIAVRNNLVADFPLCNKSFGLSYSGHDL